jgi:hypothetical protein
MHRVELLRELRQVVLRVDADRQDEVHQHHLEADIPKNWTSCRASL